MTKPYGSVEWLEEKFRGAEVDPWGLSWRGVEAVRYNRVLEILDNALKEQAKTREKLKFLDVGCSTGIFTSRLPALGGSVTGIDASETAIRRARLQHKEILFKVGSVTDPTFEVGCSNVITCLEVIYYVEERMQPAFLSAINQHLAADGFLLISSLVGRAPYFTQERLATLVKPYFVIDSAHLYGCALTAKIEGFFFGLWNKVYRIRQLLMVADQSALDEVLSSIASSVGKRESLLKLKLSADKNRPLKVIIGAATWLFLKATWISLSWKWPAKLADQVAGILHLRHTHTILLLTKKEVAKSTDRST